MKRGRVTAVLAAAALAVGMAVAIPAPAQAVPPGQSWVLIKCAAGYKARARAVTYSHAVTISAFDTRTAEQIGTSVFFWPRFTGAEFVHPWQTWQRSSTRFSFYSDGYYSYSTGCVAF